jgi:hypothetical protein
MNGMGGYNSNQWNDMGGMDYNLPGSYGSPLGQGQFAPMPQMFQQYLQQMGQFGGGMGFPGQRGSMNNQFYGGMVNDFFGNQQPRFGGGQTPSYDEWRGGLMTDMMMRSPEEDAAREQGFRDRYNEEFGQQGSYEDYRNNWQRSNRFANGQFGTLEVRPGEDIPLSEEEWRASQGGGAPAGKDGTPLRDPHQAGSVGTDPLSFLRNQTMINNGMAPSFNQRRRGFNRNAETAPQPMEPMPAYDRPENMNYNMAALRQMMGGG